MQNLPRNPGTTGKYWKTCFFRKRANRAKKNSEKTTTATQPGNRKHPRSSPPDQEAGQPTHPHSMTKPQPPAGETSVHTSQETRPKKIPEKHKRQQGQRGGANERQNTPPGQRGPNSTKPGSIHARTVRPTATTTFGLVARIPRPTASSAFEFRSQLPRQRVAEQPTQCPRDYHVTRETTSQKTTSFRFLFASATQMHHNVQDQWA